MKEKRKINESGSMVQSQMLKSNEWRSRGAKNRKAKNQVVRKKNPHKQKTKSCFSSMGEGQHTYTYTSIVYGKCIHTRTSYGTWIRCIPIYIQHRVYKMFIHLQLLQYIHIVYRFLYMCTYLRIYILIEWVSYKICSYAYCYFVSLHVLARIAIFMGMSECVKYVLISYNTCNKFILTIPGYPYNIVTGIVTTAKDT